MSKLILSYKNLLVSAVCILVFVIIQAGVGHELILKKTDIWEGVPVFTGWEGDEDKVKMKVSCDGKEGYISEGKIIVSYLKNPNQPLPVLVLYEDGHVAVK